MAIIISQIKTTLDEPKDNAVAKALSLLRLSRAETASAKLYKSSVDARRDICFVNSVYIAMKDPAKERRLAEKHQNVRLYEPGALSFTRGKERLRGDVYVAGFGPAGMFCALTLCEFGYRPVVLERGADMDSRGPAVSGRWRASGQAERSTRPPTCSSARAARERFPTESSPPESGTRSAHGCWNASWNSARRRTY